MQHYKMNKQLLFASFFARAMFINRGSGIDSRSAKEVASEI